MSSLPLKPEHFSPTRHYLQDVVKVMGSLQRAFVPANPHDWHYGLEVVMRGLRTQPLNVAGQETPVLLDLVRHKVRFGTKSWSLSQYDGPQIMRELVGWLDEQGVKFKLEEPEFAGQGSRFDPAQADAYAAALWWVDAHFRRLADHLNEGLISPILLYPHHFDLAITWFPWGDERQLSTGFSMGDDSLDEPYIYLSAYPEPKKLKTLKLPAGAYWQSGGFSGAVLPYAKLQAAKQPDVLIHEFTAQTFLAARQLF